METPEQRAPKSFPSRTSILVAAARAFGSRDEDAGVRNPDFLAEQLIGPGELSLIGDHPFKKALEQPYAEGFQNPGIVLFASLMILRTRFIDEALKRAVKNGATQIVILGAGFDSRPYRFEDLLKSCLVFEVDTEPTQEYKRQRIQMVLDHVPANLFYVGIDFEKDELMGALETAGFRKQAKSFYIWEGVSMYLPESSVREVLRLVAMHSAPGSSIVLDYANSLAIEITNRSPNGPAAIPASWGEPWIFGVPGANGEDFFRELGFDPGVPLSMNSEEVLKRYAVRRDGTTYAQHALKKMRAEAEERVRAGTAVPLRPSVLETQKAIAAAGGVYWLAELTVKSNPRVLEETAS